MVVAGEAVANLFTRHSPPACMLETGAPRPVSTSFSGVIPASADRISGDVPFTGRTVSRKMIPDLLL